MGFVRATPTYRLVFEDPSLAGLVVRVRSVSTGQLMDVVNAYTRLLPALTGGGTSLSADDAAGLELLFTSFADALKEWNVEDEDGRAVPADLSGVRTLDLPFTMLLLQEWMQAAGGVPGPLGGGSTPGATDGEQEMGIPMEPLAGLPS